MALHGEVWANAEKILAWEAVFRETEEDRGEDGTESVIYTHVYDVTITWADGYVARREVTQRPNDGSGAETLAAKVLLGAAWEQRAVAKEREKGKRRGTGTRR